jgi:DNA-directed RNA polymerase subunit RPC12/RpoP
MKAQTIILVLSGVALIFLGVIFLIASVYETTRMITGAFLSIAGFLLLFFASRTTGEPAKKYVVELPSQVAVQSIKCPICGAQITAENVTVDSGITRVKCTYCGSVSQISEEPKW